MSEHDETFRNTVIAALNISPDQYRADLSLGDIDEWDSVAHLDLVFALEQAFDSQMTPDEMVDLTGLSDLHARFVSAT